jgi:uncharacterized protein (DUF433 family)
VTAISHISTNIDQHIIRDPKICGAEAVFKRTRITLGTVLASLATGDTAEAIVTGSLTPQDVQAAIAFAAASGEEDLPVPAAPRI